MRLLVSRLTFSFWYLCLCFLLTLPFQVSTLEATRLLLLDMGTDPSLVMPLVEWQMRADAAAKKQLGPQRIAPAA